MRERLKYLFTSTNGLMLLAVGLVSLVTAVWGTLSGPMVEWGVRDVSVRLLGMDLGAQAREGRVVLLYHSIAVAVVAVLVYMMTDNIRMRDHWRAFINGTATVSYIATMFGGLGYGYFGHNPTLHGIYVAGLATMFVAGVFLAVATWPWDPGFRLPDDSPYAHTTRGLDLERLAFWITIVATLGSAALGAWAGSYYGQGFQTFLAEDVVRNPHKDMLQLAVIGHLHIMLALMAIALTLVIGRWFDFKGRLHTVAMWSMIVGTATLSMGAWSVVPYESIAHIIIYVGSVFAMLGALFLVIYGFGKLVRNRLDQLGVERAGFGTRLRALLHDPLRFGALWQMIFMNFTVSGVGIFMAVKLDDIFRKWPLREERIELTGHWHALSLIIATIILFYFADKLGVKGWVRQVFGWVTIVASDTALAAVTVFGLKRLFVDPYTQQSLVNNLMVFIDAGLGVMLVGLGGFLVWRLVDLFKRGGHWSDNGNGGAA